MIEKPPPQKVADITMKWSELESLLRIFGGPVGKSTTIIVNEVEYELEFDEFGQAQIGFKRSEPAIFYSVRFKAVDEGLKDQRMGFLF